MTMHVPGPILEAVDGVFLVLLLFMFGATFHYTIVTSSRSIRAFGLWKVNRWSVETKAAWALSMIFFGLILRVGSHWALRHAANHGLHWEAFTATGPTVILISTVLTTWGSVCWIRSVIPLRCGTVSWTTAVIIAVVFGVWMAA